jgi:subtilisin family serine protease
MTGRGIRIAVIDSGVHASLPHINRIAGGVGIDARGVEGPDYVDRLGHGTAVAAAILEKAPEADLFTVKVFDRSLATSITSLVAAIEWAVRQNMHLVNLSLGTARPAHEAALRAAVDHATAAGVAIVSARARRRKRDCRVVSRMFARSDWRRSRLDDCARSVPASWTGMDKSRFVRQGFRARFLESRRNETFTVSASQWPTVPGFAARAVRRSRRNGRLARLLTFLKDHAPAGAL